MIIFLEFIKDIVLWLIITTMCTLIIVRLYKLLKNFGNYKDKQNCSVKVTDVNYGTCFMKIKDFPIIEFDKFKEFYYLNPSSWTFRDCRVIKNETSRMSFTFSFFDWLEYIEWKNKMMDDEVERQKDEVERQKLEIKNNITHDILESIQKDIDKVRMEGMKSLDEAKDLMKNIRL